MKLKDHVKISIASLLVVFWIFCLFSCAYVADVAVAGSGDVVVTLNIQASPNTEVLIKSLAGENNALFNEKEISENLKTENIHTTSFKTDSFASLSASFKIPKERVNISSLFDVDLKGKKIGCNISKENLRHLIKTFPSDVREYLDLFVSPITTGENLTADEYKKMITSVYGPKIASELTTAFFKLTVSCPGVISEVKTEPVGKVRYFSGNSAVLTIPLSYMLSLEKPLKIMMTYK